MRLNCLLPVVSAKETFRFEFEILVLASYNLNNILGSCREYLHFMNGFIMHYYGELLQVLFVIKCSHIHRSSTEEVKHPIIKKQLSEVQMKHHALLVSLGLVYYMRLNSTYRERFTKELDKINYGMKFATAFMKEVALQ